MQHNNLMIEIFVRVVEHKKSVCMVVMHKCSSVQATQDHVYTITFSDKKQCV